MKLFIQLILCISIAFFMVACGDDDTKKETTGSVTLNFDAMVGDTDLELASEGSQDFPYSNSLEQAFNIDLLGYYISEIKLTKEDGSVFEDEVFADATTARGFYQVLENDAASQHIDLSAVPSGEYTSVTFTVGIKGTTVAEGATGGVLDPANGAWFWNWNVGYIAFGIEGNSTSSGSEGDELAFHIGGWSDPNNVKEIALDFPHHLIIGENTESELHIAVDVLEIIESLDFTTTYSVHSPAAGQPLAEKLSGVFEIHHVENDED